MQPKTEWRDTLAYSFPMTVGSFLRELFAVTMLLLLEERAWAYDFFTPGLVLLLVLFTCRVPYINSYAFLFETFSIDSWKIQNHVGLQKHSDFMQNLVHTVFVLLAHIGAAIAAAALRVYFDVAFGKEIMSAQPGVAPALEVSVDGLRRFDSFWNAGPRISNLKGEGYANGTIEALIPLGGNGRDLGIGQMTLIAWYVVEDLGYVCLLCVCYIHIWLGAGVGENKRAPMNPFKQRYWRNLLRVCVLLTLVYISLYRAFPTSHGSLHRTIYLCQYQAWNPNVHVYDQDNSEIFARIVGGLLGLAFGIAYNKILVNTEKRESTDESDFYYRLVWGLNPDPRHTQAKRIRKTRDEGSSSDSDGDRPAMGRMTWDALMPRGRAAPDRACTESTVCVTQRQCGPSCAMGCVCPTQVKSKPDFKLRIPYTLNHPK